MEPIGKDLALIVKQAALSMAGVNKLVDPDGAVSCWGCLALQRRIPELEPAEATLPSLHCESCLALAKRRGEGHFVRRVVNGVEYEHPLEPEERRRWRLILRNMKHEARLDRESAARLLANAKALPGAFEADINQLTEAFFERFGRDDSLAPIRPMRYRDAAR